MLIDLLDKFVDRLIELQNERKKARREILDVDIDPIFSEFEIIHKGKRKAGGSPGTPSP